MKIFGIDIFGLKEQLSRTHDELVFNESDLLKFIDEKYHYINSTNQSINNEIEFKKWITELALKESTRLNTKKLNDKFDKDTKEAKEFALKIYKLNNSIEKIVDDYFNKKDFFKNIFKTKTGIDKLLN